MMIPKYSVCIDNFQRHISVYEQWRGGLVKNSGGAKKVLNKKTSLAPPPPFPAQLLFSNITNKYIIGR